MLVRPFQDQRPETERLGVRTPLSGNPQEFRLGEGDAGSEAARLLVHLLNAHGWHAELLGDGEGPGTDVVLTGQIQRFSVDAEGGLLQTTIRMNSLLHVEALSQADGSIVRQTLTGVGSQGVFWFEVDDAEALMNEVLAASFRKFLSSTTVKQRKLRLK